MTWRAIVPLKAPGQRKSRLDGILSSAERDQLSERMFAHVTSQLASCSLIASVSVLAPVRPRGWAGGWAPDGGLGLNGELMRLRALGGRERLLVVHADLPGLCVEDVSALVRGAEAVGVALAADRHGEGTNAVALKAEQSFAFCFGPQSLALHKAQHRNCAILQSTGLSWDIDTPEDLALLRRATIASRLAPAPLEPGLALI
jgi:2-phospho-L-lactate guanylyltransferase